MSDSHGIAARRTRLRLWARLGLVAAVAAAGSLTSAPALGTGPKGPQGGGSGGPQDLVTPYAALAFNDLGMHCMNSDYSEMLILPPFNNLHVQVIRRGIEPSIVTSGVTVRYSFPNNTHSADKSNFWSFPQPIFGAVPPNIGLTGNGLAGTMARTTSNDWAATGIPIIPIDDLGRESPYNLAAINVVQNGSVVAQTRAVVPTSTEMSCNICHNTPGISTASDILLAHDRLHGTTLMAQRPVLCASCHSDNALGLPGQPGVSSLSAAMHGAHAPRMSQAGLPNECYACHPGIRTNCQRDVHLSNNITCTNCHGNMTAVGSPARNPWVDEPRCTNCHNVPGHEYEQPGVLFKAALGHGGVHCASCHGSPHAITPAATPIDNAQANLLQGHSGVIDTCLVCHTQQPSGSFPHVLNP